MDKTLGVMVILISNEKKIVTMVLIKAPRYLKIHIRNNSNLHLRF